MTCDPRVAIIGASHGYQVADYVPKARESAAFEAYIRRFVRVNTLAALAEEMPDDALTGCYKGATTVARRVAKLEGLKYLQVDLTHAERAALGIPTRGSIQFALDNDASDRTEARAIWKGIHVPRENVWLERILKFGVYPLGLIVGAMHVRSMRDRLRSHGLEARVAVRDWRLGSPLRRC